VPEPSRPPVIVVLNAAGAGDSTAVPASFIASISGDGRALVTRPLLNVSVEANRVLELWAVPPSGAPRSLGLISAAGATVVKKGKLLDGTAALAVSLEPTGGSPTGAPTGPILFVGKLTL
jgi:anti-sigma-K factor RskA